MATEPKNFDMAAIKPFYATAESEGTLANVSLRLPEGRTHRAKQSRRLTATLRRSRAAIETIKRLPEVDESLHCALNGEFALYDFIPATLEVGGEVIDELLIVTLGFSKKNIESLSELVDAGRLCNIGILCSHYFSAADRPIYDHAVEFCAAHGFPIVAMRAHAKLLLMRTATRWLVVESSENLRSCHNIGQATMFNDAGLYAFHRNWIADMLSKGAAT